MREQEIRETETVETKTALRDGTVVRRPVPALPPVLPGKARQRPQTVLLGQDGARTVAVDPTLHETVVRENIFRALANLAASRRRLYGRGRKTN